MKKLLAIFAATGLVVSTSAVMVSCSDKGIEIVKASIEIEAGTKLSIDENNSLAKTIVKVTNDNLKPSKNAMDVASINWNEGEPNRESKLYVKIAPDNDGEVAGVIRANVELDASGIVENETVVISYFIYEGTYDTVANPTDPIKGDKAFELTIHIKKQ